MKATPVEATGPSAGELATEGPPAGAVESRYRCSFCGSEDVEAMAWVRLNDETISSFDETPDYWCPDCNEHRRGACTVNPAGQCTMHDQPFTECQAQARANEEGVPR